MRFSIFNCLMCFVALASLVAWQVDKKKLEATIDAFSEEARDSFDWQGEQIDNPGIIDAFSLGYLTFVYFESEVTSGAMHEVGLRRLRDVIHPADAAQNGKPIQGVSSILDNFVGGQHELLLTNASAVSRGTDGFYWVITWDITLAGGMGSGIPHQYRCVVRADGTVVHPSIILNDFYGAYGSDRGVLFSVIPIDRLLPTGAHAVREEEVVTAADAALSDAVSRLGVSDTFRFDSINHLTIADPQQRVASELEVWAVDFVNSSIGSNVKNTNSATRLTVWVTSDLATSEISAETWTVPDEAKHTAE